MEEFVVFFSDLGVYGLPITLTHCCKILVRYSFGKAININNNAQFQLSSPCFCVPLCPPEPVSRQVSD